MSKKPGSAPGACPRAPKAKAATAAKQTAEKKGTASTSIEKTLKHHFSKAELKTMPPMPKSGRPTEWLGAKIYLSAAKKQIRIIMNPPDYASERIVKYSAAMPSGSDLVKVKAKIIECKHIE